MQSVNKRILSWLTTLGFVLCALIAALLSLRWPLMGDCTYMHYAVRLMHHGMRPYADIAEMNMPGSYLLEAATLHIFGSGDLAWRLYDITLSAILLFFMMRMTTARVAGLCAAALLIVIHLQDGVMMGGERDYAMAVFLVASIFFAIQGVPPANTIAAFLSGAAFFTAVTIKPTAIVFFFPLLWWIGLRILKPFVAFVAGSALPLIVCAAWLARWNATQAFFYTLGGLVRYHASLDNKPIGFLLTHAVSPFAALVCLWLIGAALHRNVSRLQWMLRLCTLCGWLTYTLQRKGFSYQRYAFLAFLLLAVAFDFTQWFTEKKLFRWLAVTGTAFALVLSIFLTVRVSTYSHMHPEQAIAADIAHFTSTGQPQCMDTAGYCIAALERLQKIQPTGLIYDCYLTRNDSGISQTLREEFLQRITIMPPQVIVITDSVCYGEPRTFDKYANWPQFQTWMTDHYTLVAERHPTQPERYWSRATLPFAWRIYTRK